MSEREARKARMAAAAASRTTETAPPAGRTGIRTAPVRVTLNIPPELFRQLSHWLESAADTLDAPRVSQQDALRAMIWAVVNDTPPARTGAVSGAVLDELREQRA
jgi:hypothetical protein